MPGAAARGVLGGEKMPSPPGMSFATRGDGVWAGVSAQGVSALPWGEAQPAGPRG